MISGEGRGYGGRRKTVLADEIPGTGSSEMDLEANLRWNSNVAKAEVWVWFWVALRIGKGQGMW